MCHLSIQFLFKIKLKIDVNFFICKSAKSKILVPFDRLLKNNLYFYFNPVNNKEKMKLSGNVAFPTILQSVAWLSNSVFGRSLKIENWPGQLPCLRDWEGSESLIVSS